MPQATDRRSGSDFERVRALERSGLLDQPEDDALQRLVRLTATVMDTPIALISLIDQDRQWCLARHGLNQKQTPRAVSFCTHTIQQDTTLVVPDARQDPRFSNNPLVTSSPHIRFYAGCPLRGKRQHKLGTLCVIDRHTRMISQAQLQLLEDLSDIVNRDLIARHALLTHHNGLVAKSDLFSFVLTRELERAATTQTPLSLIALACDQHEDVCGVLGITNSLRWLLSICSICTDNSNDSDFIGLMDQRMIAVLLPDTNIQSALARAVAMRMALRHSSAAIDLPHGTASFSAMALEVQNRQIQASELLQLCEQKLKGLQANLGDQTASDCIH